jgi:hypothetical protein
MDDVTPERRARTEVLLVDIQGKIDVLVDGYKLHQELLDDIRAGVGRTDGRLDRVEIRAAPRRPR